MKERHKLSYLTGFLSAFDIKGSLLSHDFDWKSKGLEHDYNQLMGDQKTLEKDYKIISKES